MNTKLNISLMEKTEILNLLISISYSFLDYTAHETLNNEDSREEAKKTLLDELSSLYQKLLSIEEAEKVKEIYIKRLSAKLSNRYMSIDKELWYDICLNQVNKCTDIRDLVKGISNLYLSLQNARDDEMLYTNVLQAVIYYLLSSVFMIKTRRKNGTGVVRFLWRAYVGSSFYPVYGKL